MKAIGYVSCATCHEVTRGYAPRGWKPGDELAVWAHNHPGTYGRGATCPGSYKPGVCTRTDEQMAHDRATPVATPHIDEYVAGRARRRSS